MSTTKTPRGSYKPRKKSSPLERRALALVRRGFDVPPSKMSDYNRLLRNNLTALEAKELLELE